MDLWQRIRGLARRAGFAAVDFSTAHVMTKAVGSDVRGFPIFLMVARTV